MATRYHTPTIEFYCRPSKIGRNGLAPVEMAVTINKVRKFFNTTMKVKPSDFNRKRRPKEIQDYVELMRQRFNTIITEMLRNGQALTTETVRDYLRTGGYKSYTVGDMVDGFLALKRKGVDSGDLRYGQYKKYLYTANVLYKYVPKEKEITELTPALMQTIYADLKIRYKAETSCGYMGRIKSFVRFAIDNGKLVTNPMQGIKIVKAKHNIHYLTEAEINRINTMEIDNKSLSDIRDAFILQASTGLAYSDIYSLKASDIMVMDDGTHYICKQRNKTGTQYTSVVLPMGVEVLKKHNYQLHIISNQKYNMMLRAIQILAGIETRMTTHLARKTYATTLINRGVRIEVVSKALGHKNVKITQAAYSQLLNNTVIEEIKGKI